MKISREEKAEFIDYLVGTYGNEVSRKNIMEAARNAGLKEPQWLFNDPVYKADRGFYRFGSAKAKKAAPVARSAPQPAQHNAPTERPPHRGQHQCPVKLLGCADVHQRQRRHGAPPQLCFAVGNDSPPAPCGTEQ